MARKLTKKKLKEREKVKENLKFKGKWEKQIKLIVIFMAFLILIVFLFYWLSIEMRKFEYAGLQFEKGKQGNLVLYLGKFPLKDMFGNVVSYLSVYFREDPRKLKRIEIEGTINLNRDVALVLDPELRCDDSIVAGTTLAIFLGKIGINPFGATLNKTDAEINNREYVECNEISNYTVISFHSGNESKIIGKGDCYILSIAGCEIMNVTERFIMGLYAYSQGIELK